MARQLLYTVLPVIPVIFVSFSNEAGRWGGSGCGGFT